MSEVPRVSVIVLFDRGEFEPCLTSLLTQEGVAHEIIAVVSHQGAAPADGHFSGRLQFLAEENRNPALRRNRAAAQARGKYLAFIDDDAMAPPDWLKRGVEYLENSAVFAGVGGPNLCPPNAPSAELLSDFVLSEPLLGGGSRAYRGGGRPAPARPGEIHLVNFIVRKDWFDRVGGFNEALGYGGEDTEFLYQAQKLGGKFIFEPELIVYHHRRRWGLPYLGQRFRLRRQSAHLFVAYPGIYIRHPGFLAALFLPPLFGAMFFLCSPIYPAALLAAAGLGSPFFALLRGKDKWRRFWGEGWWFFHFLFSFVFHFSVNLAGLWWGLLESVFSGPWRVRKRLRRHLNSCQL